MRLEPGVAVTQGSRSPAGGPRGCRSGDPGARRRFVLLSEEEYERLTGYDTGPWTDEERDLLRAEAVEALGWEGMEAYQDDRPGRPSAETLS
jgi:hypothetical protein